MKDVSVKNIPKETVYKDVVIIGNGPSGISLSYMLAGNWPYWNPKKIEKHPDELLRARLNYADSNKSLVMQDLKMLSEGLEGRSTNPVSLLLDSLAHPCADIGMELPSMLEYKYNENCQIDHIVLGKGPPGGSWHRMDPNLRTLSLAAWMSLPGLSFSDWEAKQLKNKIHKQNQQDEQQMENSCRKCLELRSKEKLYNLENNIEQLENNNESEIGALCCKCTKELLLINDKRSAQQQQQKQEQINRNISSNSNSNNSNNDLLKFINKKNQLNDINLPKRRNLSLKRQISKEVQTRALVSRVAQYYKDYIYEMDLDKYFLNETIVTMIAPLHESCAHGKFKLARWIVYGINKTNGKAFYYACRNIVLANGVSDLANHLGLRGEILNVSWVKHELPQLETVLEGFNDQERSQLKPVLIVGAGLSAADAVTICRSSDIHVIHVFRSRTAGLDKMLPENVYPEYHEVHRMMKDQNNIYDFYTPLPEHKIIDLTTGTNGVHKCTVQNLNTNDTKTFDISFCAILIGSRPDLYFTTTITKCPIKLHTTIRTFLDKTTNLQQQHQQQQQQQQQQLETTTLLTRKLTWFKSLCAKCKHLNLCDWTSTTTSRRFINNNSNSNSNNHKNYNSSEYRKICDHKNDCSTATPTRIIDNDLLQHQQQCPNGGSTTNESGYGLGLDPTKPIDSKTNQIAVNKYTNELLRSPPGLYAMGPLVGDNFVRFIPGGALAITSSLYKEND